MINLCLVLFQVSLARSMSFVPPAECCTGCANQNISSNSVYYDVVGVISGTNSQNTIAAATLLNIFHIPMIGAVSTSELLSNKVKYEYFLRVVPSDRFQAKAIIDILLHFNWTYISVLNSEGSYGEMGGKSVRNLASESGICIAYSKEINKARGGIEYDEIVDNLLRYPNAKVVVMFVQGGDAHEIVSRVKQRGYCGLFIWITSDGVSPIGDLNDLEDTGAGGFFINLFSTGAPGFSDYFESLSPSSSTNPWLEPLWETSFECSFGSNSSEQCNPSQPMVEIHDYGPYNKTALFLDSVLSYAHAIQNAVNELCPWCNQNITKLKQCITGNTLLPYLKNVTFEGVNGPVKFDKNGDADGKYQIDQLHPTMEGSWDAVTVGVWEKATETLIFNKPLYWASNSIPESVCSKPCHVGEYYVQLELKCCWECRKCR